MHFHSVWMEIILIWMSLNKVPFFSQRLRIKVPFSEVAPCPFEILARTLYTSHCIYIYIHVSLYLYIYTSHCIYIYIHVSLYLYIYTHLTVFIYIHVSLYLYIYTCLTVFIYIYTRLTVFIYIHVSLYLYIFCWTCSRPGYAGQ